MMKTHGNHSLFLPLLVFGIAATWHQTLASEFLCRNGDQTRRVAVDLGGRDRNVACEVRYWRNAALAGDGEVLWQATQDEDFCAAKARELLGRLQRGGWTCAQSEQPAPSESSRAEATPSAPSSPASPQPASEAPLRAQAPAEPVPGAVHETSPAAPGQPSATSTARRPQQPPTPPTAAPAAQPPPPTAAPPTAASSGREPATSAARSTAIPAANQNAALLDQVVSQTLRSVQQLYGGDFRAEDKAFGDLDGDGLDDAAILVTYQADRDDYVQYLVAYLFDGETFQSSATKNLGGRFLDVQRAEVDGIVDRSIVVVLQALDGDDGCCETRRTAFALKEGQLVEVAKPAPR